MPGQVRMPRSSERIACIPAVEPSALANQHALPLNQSRIEGSERQRQCVDDRILAPDSTGRTEACLVVRQSDSIDAVKSIW